MRYEKMTPDEMLSYVKTMDETLPKLIAQRDKIIEEIKGMQNRKDVLSWEEIASAVAYPKAMSDKERISGSMSDESRLLYQLERINNIYTSQMEDLCEEMVSVETRIGKIRFVERCMGDLERTDKEILNGFTRKNITYERAAAEMHMTRNTLYKFQRKAITNLTEIYNNRIV